MRYTRKRCVASLAGAAFLLLAGFGVRCAEDNQVGYTHDTSMWVFVASGLLAYYAAIVAYVLWRRRKQKGTR